MKEKGAVLVTSSKTQLDNGFYEDVVTLIWLI